MVSMPVGIETTKQEEKMKKILVVLLSLGLIAAFGMTASAQTMKVGGSYYLAGVYDDNPNLTEGSYSRAYFFQRVRLQPVFQIAEGLTFTVRMDALEKQVGGTSWRRGVAVGDDTTSSRASVSAIGLPTALPGTATTTVAQNIQESIEFERAYVTFLTGIGQFQVGYQAADEWGTAFGDSGSTKFRILYATKAGPVTLAAIYEKVYEANRTTVVLNANKVDSDNDTYALTATYKQGPMEAGLLYKYYNYAAGVPALGTPGRTGGGASKYSLLAPYMKATFGPVYVEGEVNYFFGKLFKSEIAGVPDVDLRGLGAYLNAKMNLGPAWVGALVGFSSGDDGSDPTKFKMNIAGGGSSWNPALILMNDDLATYGGATAATNAGASSTTKYNMILGQLYGGFKPMPKLSLDAALTYAKAHKVAAGHDKKMGTEFDVTATYKIYDNLSYMVGAGYLWTGDFFKFGVPAAKIDDDYMLMNRLNLSF
jgi:predicted porin